MADAAARAGLQSGKPPTQPSKTRRARPRTDAACLAGVCISQHAQARRSARAAVVRGRDEVLRCGAHRVPGCGAATSQQLPAGLRVARAERAAHLGLAFRPALAALLQAERLQRLRHGGGQRLRRPRTRGTECAPSQCAARSLPTSFCRRYRSRRESTWRRLQKKGEGRRVRLNHVYRTERSGPANVCVIIDDDTLCRK